MDIADRNQLKVLKDLVKHPMKYLMNSIGLDETKAIEILKTKYNYTNKQIQKLRGDK